MYVVNRTRGTYLGVDIKLANTVRTRMRGLYAHRELHLGDGVWLVPCNGVQTIGMKHAVDVLFLDRERRVVRIRENLQPGRFTWWVLKAHSVLEVPAGAVSSSETRVGDHLDFVEPAGLSGHEGQPPARVAMAQYATSGGGDEAYDL